MSVWKVETYILHELSKLSEIPSPDISTQLSMKSALWINLNFSSLFNFLIPTLQYSVKSLANRYDCIDVPREKMYIYAPDIFLVSILNECSISITVLMCHREMYIYAPDNFLNEWMNEWINQWKKHEEQETNEHSMEARTMKKWSCKWNMYDLLPSIMKFYRRKYMLTKKK